MYFGEPEKPDTKNQTEKTKSIQNISNRTTRIFDKSYLALFQLDYAFLVKNNRT